MVAHPPHARDTQPVVEVRDVAKVYQPGMLARLGRRGGIHALRGVDLVAWRGEVFGLLGPNGAGKSTLVKILLGLVRPTRLSGTLLGRNVGDRGARTRVGYLPEQHRFPPYLTGTQVVEFFAAMSGLDRRSRRHQAGHWIDRLGMTPFANVPVGKYSKGMRQRIGLAQALAGDPEMVILDEPTDGVDPLGRRQIRDVLQEQKQRGMCVFVNSHLLSELELICDRVAILVAGKVARSGTLDELAGGLETFEIELASILPAERLGEILRVGFRSRGPLPGRVAPPWPMPPAPAGNQPMNPLAGPPPAAPGQSSGLGPLPYAAPHFAPPVVEASWEGHMLTYEPGARLIRLSADDLASATRALDALRAAHVLVRRFAPARPTLEDLFLSALEPEGNVQSPAN